MASKASKGGRFKTWTDTIRKGFGRTGGPALYELRDGKGMASDRAAWKCLTLIDSEPNQYWQEFRRRIAIASIFLIS